ncbi:MAG: BrnT family toxin [Pseudomonadota bacterium]
MAKHPRVLFDPAKDAANIEKHGLTLALASEVIAAAAATFLDDRYDYGEDRFVTFGRVAGRLYVAVWTERDGEIRAISVRRANQRELRKYG